ncbi:hypothetical protein JTF06_12735 [Desemzia sp. RIT804]|nr:hypothetical protein [Desemzia sp. RIT 804]MBM6615751.1 hypothetical protein [Desemzia sp. RIT 804]
MERVCIEFGLEVFKLEHILLVIDIFENILLHKAIEQSKERVDVTERSR